MSTIIDHRGMKAPACDNSAFVNLVDAAMYVGITLNIHDLRKKPTGVN